jgi:hypothetical protein
MISQKDRKEMHFLCTSECREGKFTATRYSLQNQMHKKTGQ